MRNQGGPNTSSSFPLPRRLSVIIIIISVQHLYCIQQLKLLVLRGAKVAAVAGPVPRLAAALRWAEDAALVALDDAPCVDEAPWLG